MKKIKQPAFAPDGPSHPWYELACECAITVVREAAAASINQFDPPKEFRKSRFNRNIGRHGKDGNAVRPYPESLYGWNDWPRRSANDWHIDIQPPDWCPLEASRPRGKIVVFQVVEPTRMQDISPNYSRVLEGNLHDWCFVFDPAEIATAIGLDPKEQARKQAAHDEETCRREAEWAERQAQWKAEQEARKTAWQERQTAKDVAAARRLAVQAEAAERHRKLQPPLFDLGGSDAA